MSDTAILPAHVEETVAAIAQLHAEHEARASPLQRTIELLTARAGRPSFVVGILALSAGWISLNLAMIAGGLRPIDEPPFAWLQGVVAFAALIMTSLILATQRREDEIATHREQLTLELSILSEQKSAKIIQLLEELRRDSPHLRNRVDYEAKALSVPVDPQNVLQAIKEASVHSGLGPDLPVDSGTLR